MNAWTGFTIAFFTSVVTAGGTALVVERTGVFAKAEPEKIMVPNLVGMAHAEANSHLAVLGLLALSEHELSSEAETGRVIRQSVAAGQRLPKGQPVTLTVAEALPEVPTLVGRTPEEARGLAEAAGLKLHIGEPVASGEVEVGKIADQAPTAGTSLEKGEKIIVQVSAGPAEVEVPNVSGQRYAGAKEQLEALKLEVTVRWVSLPETFEYLVLSQKPPAGDKVGPGATVELVVNR